MDNQQPSNKEKQKIVEGSTTKHERKPVSLAQDSKKLDEDIV